METKKNSQLLVPLILLSVLFSQTLALTTLETEALSFRNLRHADGVSTSNISSPLDHLSPKSYPEPLIEKRASNDISEDQGPIKRHSNTELTFAYSRLIKVKTGSKGLKKLLRGKR
ncbi:VIP peptides-like [Myotis daubentonii]|uniref:VIP peptides-like n=1 Tax=Myotis daubentonii TaxID=98922 RepID=UPI002872CF94|nr:VIP peptides-like [Myotis daubentonii]